MAGSAPLKPSKQNTKAMVSRRWDCYVGRISKFVTWYRIRSVALAFGRLGSIPKKHQEDAFNFFSTFVLVRRTLALLRPFKSLAETLFGLAENLPVPCRDLPVPSVAKKHFGLVETFEFLAER